MYSMMLNEKRRRIVASTEDNSKLPPGLLVYLKDGSVQEINNTSHAIKGL